MKIAWLSIKSIFKAVGSILVVIQTSLRNTTLDGKGGFASAVEIEKTRIKISKDWKQFFTMYVCLNSGALRASRIELLKLRYKCKTVVWRDGVSCNNYEKKNWHWHMKEQSCRYFL